MTTHRDTCPMREGDSQRRTFVYFVNGPIDGLDAWVPKARWDLISQCGEFLVLLQVQTKGVSWWEMSDVQVPPSVTPVMHIYRAAGNHRAVHVRRAS